jgi:hypothetical protein
MRVFCIAIALVALTTPALADTTNRNSAELYSGTDMLVVRMMLRHPQPLVSLVGDKLKGTVRCYTEATKIHDVGCYVGIKRDGTLTAPAFTGKPGFARIDRMAFEGWWEFTYDANKHLQIELVGNLGNAVALWTGCAQAGTVVCDDHAHPTGSYSTARFVVVAGGNVRGAIPGRKLDLSSADNARKTIKDVLARKDKLGFEACVSKRMRAKLGDKFDAYYGVWQTESSRVSADKWSKIVVTEEDGQFKLDEN